MDNTKSFVQNSFKQIVKKREDIFGIKKNVTYGESNEVVKGRQSDTIFGNIRYRNDSGKILLSPPLVLKLLPTVKSLPEVLPCQFANEIFVYGHILPYFALLESSVLELFPKFYGSFTETYPESNEAVILLENLTHFGYQSAPSQLFLDYAHLSLMVRSLGKFHALSYLAKEVDPVHFRAHALSLNPTNIFLSGKLPHFTGVCGARGLAHLSLHSEYKSFVPVIQNLLNNDDAILTRIYKNDRNHPWTVVCHGDFLAGNVMFLYDKGQPVEVKTFDLSASTFSSPVLDLASLLYINANQETRDLHWDQLIDDYCNGLSSLPIPVANLPSRDIIINEFKLKAIHAYFIASFFLPILVSDHLKLGSYHQFLPPKYIHCKDLFELPRDTQLDVLLKTGGEIGTQYLSDILKDMLNRGFIQNSSLSDIE